MPSTKRYGVRSTLPGAPNEDHEVPGLFLLVRPDQPTRQLDDDEVRRVRDLIAAGADLELVDLDKKEKPDKGRARKPVTSGEQPDEVAEDRSEERDSEAAIAARLAQAAGNDDASAAADRKE